MTSAILKVLWRWVSGKAAGEDTLEAVVTSLHTGGSGHMVALHLDRDRDEVRQLPE